MKTIAQDKQKNKKQMVSLLLLSLSIAIGFFFTIDQGYTYMERKDTLEVTKKEVIEKKAVLTNLEGIVLNIQTNTEFQDDIERYGGQFREDTILNSLFVPITGISIASIALSEGERTPNGLSLATISLSFKAQDTNTLNAFLNYLTNSKINKKSYIIQSLNFPLDTTKNEPVSGNIELGMYYFK